MQITYRRNEKYISVNLNYFPQYDFDERLQKEIQSHKESEGYEKADIVDIAFVNTPTSLLAIAHVALIKE